MSTTREREQAVITGFDSVEEMIQAQTLEAITEAAAKIREQDALIASQAAEIERLTKEGQSQWDDKQRLLTNAERYSAQQATQIQTLREALIAVQEDICGLLCPATWKTADGRPPCSERCQAVKAALAQVSASPKEGQ